MRFSSLLVLTLGVGVGGTFAAAGCSSGRMGIDEPPPQPQPQPDLDSGIIDEPPSPPAMGPQPTFGPTVTQKNAPPPISGGTLMITSDAKTAVAADPDRDAVFLVDLASKAVTRIDLAPGDEPGRVVADGSGRAHVALRRGGAVATIDLATQKLVAKRNVCAAPRGLAFDATNDALLVACAGGELVTMATDPTVTTPKRKLQLDRDLRDVVLQGGKVWITRFRSAELLQLDDAGAVVSRATPQAGFGFDKSSRSPAVAWRAVPMNTEIAVVHQGGSDDPVGVEPGGYGGGKCGGGIVEAELTIFANGVAKPPVFIPNAVLPVDVAIAKNGKIAVASPGNAANATNQITIVDPTVPSDPCGGGGGSTRMIDGQATAVAFADTDTQSQLVVQSREPARLLVMPVDGSFVPFDISLATDSRLDTGHAIFHASSGGGIACASCHPEGGDDGRTWNFVGIGPRRTQTFRGGLLGSEPFHWDGDQKNLSMLMTTVFQGRMSGPALANDQIGALGAWVDHIPTIAHGTPSDAAAVARGQALFQDPAVGCASCHSGPRFSNDATVDVGTGGAFQVPSLRGLAFRAPYLHSGCARTLTDRFGACGGGDLHGKTSHLTNAQIADLVAYLETL